MNETQRRCQPSLSADFTLLPWLILRTILVLALFTQVSASWLTCLLQRPFSDNLIPVLAAAISTASLKHYYKTAPSLAFRPAVGGLAVLFAMCILTVGGAYLQFSRLYWLGFLGMLAALLWTIAGIKYSQHWFPLLLFSSQMLAGTPLPFVNWLSIGLKTLSMSLAIGMASPLIPVFYKNDVFFVRGYPFQVTAACCGLAMWESLVFVVLLWQLIKPMPLRSIAILQICAAVAAVLMNGIRLALTATIAYFSSPQIALAIHSNLEYILFPVALLILWKVKDACTNE